MIENIILNRLSSYISMRLHEARNAYRIAADLVKEPRMVYSDTILSLIHI